MSDTIENKVVEMQFDNRQFEKNVQGSMNTLERLKNSLNIKNVGQSLDGLTEASQNVDLDHLATAADDVRVRFSALQVIGVTALSNIANSAISAGKNLINMFAIEPRNSGFQKYELKMGAVQTIMSSTGASIEEVNGYLAALNAYSDKTIYSFSDMTNNIGKFTNAGVKLDDAVAAIKGISNEAAVSGANAAEASRAMYNFAQALSAGYVKLIDWKSIENANMATVEFKQELMNTAVASGTLKKNLDGTYETMRGRAMSATLNFNDSLQDQWMTSEVLIGTLKNYASETTDIGKKAYSSAQDVKTLSMMMNVLKEAAESGWGKTWELLVGDLEEAKMVFTDLSNFFGNIIGNVANGRNAFMQKVFAPWRELTEMVNAAGIETETFNEGLSETISQHGYDVEKLVEEYGSLGRAIESGAIPASYVNKTLKNISNTQMTKLGQEIINVKDEFKKLDEVSDQVLNGDFGEGDTVMKKLTSAGYDYEAVMKVVNEKLETGTFNFDNYSEAQLEALGYTQEDIKSMQDFRTSLLNTESPLNELIGRLNEPGGRMLLVTTLKNGLEALNKILNVLRDAFKEAFDIDEYADEFRSFLTALSNFSEKLIISDEKADKLKKTFRALFTIIRAVANIVGGILSGAFRILSSILGPLLPLLSNILTAVGEFLIRFADSNVFSSFSSAITSFADKVEKGLNEILRVFSSDTQSVSTDGEETGESFIHSILVSLKNGVGTIYDYVSGIVSNIIGYLKNIKWSQIYAIVLGSGLIYIVTKIAKTIGSLFGFIPKIIKGFNNGMSSVLEQTKNVTESFSKTFNSIAFSIKVKALTEMAKGLALAIAIIVGCALLLTIPDTDEMSKALSALAKISIGFLAMTGILLLLSKAIDKFEISKINIMLIGSTMVALASAMLAVGLVAKLMSTIKDPKAMWRGVAAVAVLSGVVAGLTFVAGLFKKGSVKIVASILAMTITISLLAGLVALMSSGLFDADKLKNATRSLSMVIISLALFAGLSKLAKDSSKSILAMTVPLIAMGVILHFLSKNDVKNSIGAGVALSVLALSLALTMAILSKVKALDGRTIASMIGVAAGMLVLAASLRVLAGFKWDDLKGGILGLAAAMAILLLGSAVLSIPALSAGVGLLVLALVGFSAALVIASVGIWIISKALQNVAPILPLIGAGFEALGRGIAGFVTTIASSSSSILEFLGVMSALGTSVLGVLAKAALGMVLAGIGAVALGAGAVVAAIGIALLAAALYLMAVVLSSGMEMIVGTAINLAAAAKEAGVNLVAGFVEGISQGIATVIEACTNFVTSVIGTICNLLGIHSPSTVFKKIGGYLLDGFVDGIMGNLFKAKDATSDMADSAVDGVLEGDSVEKAEQAGESTAEKFVNGIKNGIAEYAPLLKGAGSDAAEAVADGATDSSNGFGFDLSALPEELRSKVEAVAPDFTNGGFDLMSFLGTGISDGSSIPMDQLKTMLTSTTGTLEDFDVDYKQAGIDLATGFGDGIREKAWYAVKMAQEMAKLALEKARKELDSHSPSRKFKKLGGYSAEGFAIGIKNESYMAENASRDMAKSVLDSASGMMDSLQSLSSGNALQPVIRPVFDDSSLAYKTYDLSANIDTRIGGPVNSLASVVADAQYAINSSNMEVISAINRLRDDMVEFYSADDKEISLYVDSKKLASSLASPMNRQLNILSKRGAYV